MVVRVKWFYHPEETRLGKRHRDGKVKTAVCRWKRFKSCYTLFPLVGQVELLLLRNI